MRVCVCTVEGLDLGSQMLQVGESKVTSRISKLLHVQEPRHLCKYRKAFKGAFGSILFSTFSSFWLQRGTVTLSQNVFTDYLWQQDSLCCMLASLSQSHQTEP